MSGQPVLTVACHCLDRQRRTGAAFGLGAFYPTDALTIAGVAQEYTRHGTSGGEVRNSFCPTCGSTVFWNAQRAPLLTAVAVGAFAAGWPQPDRSIWEERKHPWVHLDAGRHEPGPG